MTDVHHNMGDDRLHTFNSRYNDQTKKTSSFPSILTQYTKTYPRAKKVHWSWREADGKNDRKGQRKSPEEFESLGNVIEKKGKSEMRAMKIDAVAREQLAHYDSYIKRLNEKLTRQREEIKRRAEELENRLAEEERRRARKPRKTHRLPLVHDADHYKKYPKTRFGKIVLLQDDLRKKGMLRCQEDLDKFWRRNMNSLDSNDHSEYLDNHDKGFTSRSEKLVL